MKTLVAAICGQIIFSSAACAADLPSELTTSTDSSWTTVFSTEARYFYWRNNFGAPNGTGPGRGSEFYLPFAMQLTGKSFETWNADFTVRGGWVKAIQSTPGHSGTVQTTTDTVASGTVTYLGLQGIQPFVALNANLPTGKTVLLGSQANARMDPDFVDISTFGEGFNLGPTAGFNFPITDTLLITTSLGYTWRGRFTQDLIGDLTNPFLTSRVDPGENLTATGAINYQIGQLALGFTGAVTWETPTSVDGTNTLQPGNRFLLALQASYIWPDNIGTTVLNASLAHSNRNKILLPGFSFLAIETLNSNSNAYRVGLQHMIPVGNFQIGPVGSVLYRDHNGYNSATLQFVPPKTRWSAGMLAQYTPKESVTINARFEGIWTRENENPALDGGKFDDLAGGVLPAATVPTISGTGWQTSIGINIKL